MKIINKLDIKLGQFTQEELNVVLTKIKNRKAASLNEILPEVWKTRCDEIDDMERKRVNPKIHVIITQRRVNQQNKILYLNCLEETLVKLEKDKSQILAYEIAEIKDNETEWFT